MSVLSPARSDAVGTTWRINARQNAVLRAESGNTGHADMPRKELDLLQFAPQVSDTALGLHKPNLQTPGRSLLCSPKIGNARFASTCLSIAAALTWALAAWTHRLEPENWIR